MRPQQTLRGSKDSIMETALRNVLLVEDEMIIAIDLEDTLRSFGATDISTVDTCAAALDWLKKNQPTMAILDAKLKDGYCGPVARELNDKGVPFIVYSGDPASAGEADIAVEKGFWLFKASSPEDLKVAIASLTA